MYTKTLTETSSCVAASIQSDSKRASRDTDRSRHTTIVYDTPDLVTDSIVSIEKEEGCFRPFYYVRGWTKDTKKG